MPGRRERKITLPGQLKRHHFDVVMQELGYSQRAAGGGEHAIYHHPEHGIFRLPNSGKKRKVQIRHKHEATFVEQYIRLKQQQGKKPVWL